MYSVYRTYNSDLCIMHMRIKHEVEEKLQHQHYARKKSVGASMFYES